MPPGGAKLKNAGGAKNSKIPPRGAKLQNAKKSCRMQKKKTRMPKVAFWTFRKKSKMGGSTLHNAAGWGLKAPQCRGKLSRLGILDIGRAREIPAKYSDDTST
jgi:hypothetical protein